MVALRPLKVFGKRIVVPFLSYWQNFGHLATVAKEEHIKVLMNDKDLKKDLLSIMLKPPKFYSLQSFVFMQPSFL